MAKRGPKPYEYTQETFDLIKEASGRGLNQEFIAAKIKRDYSCFKADKKKYPEITAAIKEGRMELLEVAGDCLRERMMSGDTTAIIWTQKAYGKVYGVPKPKTVKPGKEITDEANQKLKVMSDQLVAMANEGSK